MLRAGLVPRLKRDRTNWIVSPVFRPGAKPRDRLTDALILAAHGADGPTNPQQEARWREALADDDPAPVLEEIAREAWRRHGEMDALILVPVDQAEETFTSARRPEAEAFFRLLDILLDDEMPFASATPGSASVGLAG